MSHLLGGSGGVMARSLCVAFSRLVLLLLLASGVGLLPGCRTGKGPAEYIFGLADVDTVEVRTVDGYPGCLSAVVKGTLRDTCTRIASVRQERRDNLLVVTVTTERPVDEVCAQAVKPFEVTTPLALDGLPLGEYELAANGVSTTFKWSGDVAIPR
jgi:hypothetical protein